MRASQARISLRPSDAEASAAEFAAEVRYYLAETPRQLPSRYLYDELGSALFDAICRLPWYRITRAETAMLLRHGAGILAELDPLARVVELGSGGGGKLAALVAHRRSRVPLQVHLVDLSHAALDAAARALGVLGPLDLIGHQAPYEAGLTAAMRTGVRSGRTLALFLGSNIGNFDPPAADALLRHIAASLRPGDAFLLGTDLIKPERELMLAYDDPLGVTAAFNRNLLVRINRELGADFDLDSFRHRAVWNAVHSRVEMHLVSLRPQRVRIPASSIEVAFRAGEAIWTESSYKYRAPDVIVTLERCGFRHRAQWLEDAAAFAVTLAERA